MNGNDRNDGDDSGNDVTLDDIELLVWRLLGAKDAAVVDTVLKAVQAYAEGYAVHVHRPKQIEKTRVRQRVKEELLNAANTGTVKRGRFGDRAWDKNAQDWVKVQPNFVVTGDRTEEIHAPVVLPKPEDMLDVVQYAREEMERNAWEVQAQQERELFPYDFGPFPAPEDTAEGEGPETVEKACFFEGGGSESVEKSMLFSPGEGGSPSFSTGSAEEDPDQGEDFLGMLIQVLEENKVEIRDPGEEKKQVCTNCGKGKELYKFSRDSTKVSGRRSHCKDCVKERARARR